MLMRKEVQEFHCGKSDSIPCEEFSDSEPSCTGRQKMALLVTLSKRAFNERKSVPSQSCNTNPKFQEMSIKVFAKRHKMASEPILFAIRVNVKNSKCPISNPKCQIEAVKRHEKALSYQSIQRNVKNDNSQIMSENLLSPYPQPTPTQLFHNVKKGDT